MAEKLIRLASSGPLVEVVVPPLPPSGGANSVTQLFAVGDTNLALSDWGDTPLQTRLDVYVNSPSPCEIVLPTVGIPVGATARIIKQVASSPITVRAAPAGVLQLSQYGAIGPTFSQIPPGLTGPAVVWASEWQWNGTFWAWSNGAPIIGQGPNGLGTLAYRAIIETLPLPVVGYDFTFLPGLAQEVDFVAPGTTSGVGVATLTIPPGKFLTTHLHLLGRDELNTVYEAEYRLNCESQGVDNMGTAVPLLEWWQWEDPNTKFAISLDYSGAGEFVSVLLENLTTEAIHFYGSLRFEMYNYPSLP